MKRAFLHLATPAFCVALALVTFYYFPGHTWLQQDSQIYAPILEHQRDASVLRNDILVQHPHVAYTLYDENALALRAVTGLPFRDVLAAEQVVTRAFGIWGLLMLAEAAGLAMLPAMSVAAICSLGAMIAGPQVLTIEYEPTPRAFAVPVLVCAMGLSARSRYLAAGIAAAVAFVIHPPTTLPFLAGFVLLARRARWMAYVPVGVALGVVLLVGGRGKEQHLFAALTSSQEMLQRMRTAYCWVSMWPMATIARHLAFFAVLCAACARLWPKLGRELRVWLVVLPVLGVLSMPLSWLLLEQCRWSLIPQLQPMRTLLFVTLAMQLATAAAGFGARAWWEAAFWFSCAYYPVCQSPLALALGIATAVLGARYAPIAALAAFVVIPTIGGVVNYPRLHTPELAQLSEWARANTSRDAVFLFPDAGHGLDPGIFRTEALRAVYVDWKGGGQVNYLAELGEDWWFRWQQTVARGFHPEDVPKYAGLGVQYIVLKKRTPDAPLFENGAFAVYRTR